MAYDFTNKPRLEQLVQAALEVRKGEMNTEAFLDMLDHFTNNAETEEVKVLTEAILYALYT